MIRHKTHRQVHRVASSNKTHESEVDPTGIEGLSNFSLVVELVKQTSVDFVNLYWQNINCIECKGEWVICRKLKGIKRKRAES